MSRHGATHEQTTLTPQADTRLAAHHTHQRRYSRSRGRETMIPSSRPATDGGMVRSLPHGKLLATRWIGLADGRRRRYRSARLSLCLPRTVRISQSRSSSNRGQHVAYRVVVRRCRLCADIWLCDPQASRAELAVAGRGGRPSRNASLVEEAQEKKGLRGGRRFSGPRI